MGRAEAVIDNTRRVDFSSHDRKAREMDAVLSGYLSSFTVKRFGTWGMLPMRRMQSKMRSCPPTRTWDNSEARRVCRRG
jgi:hypothetical protein